MRFTAPSVVFAAGGAIVMGVIGRCTFRVWQFADRPRRRTGQPGGCSGVSGRGSGRTGRHTITDVDPRALIEEVADRGVR